MRGHAKAKVNMYCEMQKGKSMAIGYEECQRQTFWSSTPKAFELNSVQIQGFWTSVQRVHMYMFVKSEGFVFDLQRLLT